MPLQGHDKLRSVYASILGREPDEASFAGVLRLKETLRLSDNDPMLSVLMALDSYRTVFIEAPAHAKAAVDFVLADAQRQLTAIVNDVSEPLVGVRDRLEAEFTATSAKYHAFVGKNVSATVAAATEALRETVAKEIPGVIRQAVAQVIQREMVPLQERAESLSSVLAETANRFHNGWLLRLAELVIAALLGASMALFLVRFLG